MYKKIFSMLLAASVALSCVGCVSAAEADSGDITLITLSDSGVKVGGGASSTSETAAVYTGAEIVYYHAGTDFTYGEGTEAEKHTADEAAAHTVVTITQPGTYRLTGTLSAGQIAIDLGPDAKTDPDAVVTLLLDNASVTCTVAPALIFYNVYECDTEWVAYDNDENPDYQASAIVDTSAAGANVILAAGSVNDFIGSHVARIYKEGTTKKLHKYDGAFYSRMSMNIYGDGRDDTGVLNIVADNEGLDSELHLTIHGGAINIISQDDGINTNEDYVSVTTVNGGTLTVDAGNGAEGDGIDSNGYLVINGGTVWTMANETSPDGGIDADSPILINGGFLSAFGTRNDAVSSESKQPYMELSFASTLPAGSVVKLTDAEGNTVWSATTIKTCQSITLTTAGLALDTVYNLYVDDVLQCYSGNSSAMMGRPGGMGGSQRPEGMEGQTPNDGQTPPEMPADGQTPPELPTQGDFDPGQRGQQPEGFEGGQRPEGGMGGGFGGQTQADGSGSTDFTLAATTKSFSGICDSDASGKTRVSFTVDGVTRSGRDNVITTITAITPSVELDASLIQITVADNPSEDYAETCLLSDGLEAVNTLLPDADGSYTLTVAVVSGAEGCTGATQISFTVGILPFTDVAQNASYYDSVKYVYNGGVLTGTGATTFSPAATLTRAQAVTALARMAGAAQSLSGDFSDVDSASWYAGYVGWAVENGIVQGDGQGHFLPDQNVTAQQLELMLSRYAALTGAGYTPVLSGSAELTRADFAVALHYYALTAL